MSIKTLLEDPKYMKKQYETLIPFITLESLESMISDPLLMNSKFLYRLVRDVGTFPFLLHSYIEHNLDNCRRDFIEMVIDRDISQVTMRDKYGRNALELALALKIKNKKVLRLLALGVDNKITYGVATLLPIGTSPKILEFVIKRVTGGFKYQEMLAEFYKKTHKYIPTEWHIRHKIPIVKDSVQIPKKELLRIIKSNRTFIKNIKFKNVKPISKKISSYPYLLQLAISKKGKAKLDPKKVLLEDIINIGVNNLNVFLFDKHNLDILCPILNKIENQLINKDNYNAFTKKWKTVKHHPVEYKDKMFFINSEYAFRE